MLGVFSIILASLWGVASSVRENVKREQMAEQVMLTVKNVRSLYQGQANISGGDITAKLINHNAIPNDMLRSTTKAHNPWEQTGGSFVVASSSAGNACDDGTGQFFCLRLTGLRRDSCMSIATSISGASGPPGLAGISMGANAFRTSFPITVSQALSECVATNGTLRLIYRLRQQEP